MKKLLFITLLIGLCSSCSKDEQIETQGCNSLLLLKVDFISYTFEGAKELSLTSNINQSDSLPITIDYLPAGDFGNISLYYDSLDLIFDGSIIWSGLGEIAFPENFDAPNLFDNSTSTIPLPDSSRFQTVLYELMNTEIPYESIWESISDLNIINSYLQGHKNIGLFLYTPSVGVGDPNDWDWFVIMNK